MQFLKILFWCLLAFLAAVFTLGNWSSVPVRLWGGLVAEVNLPFLLLLTFLLGIVPTLLYQHAIRWRLRHRLTALERALDLRAPPQAAPPLTADPVPTPPVPPASVPTAVPPGVS